jgi:hypothetical protein
MADKKNKPAQTREDRLKAALKANMARRKAQAKARSGAELPKTDSLTGSSAGKPKEE